jgi:glycosyltransferase involved in cell wall biosynthesis
MKILMIAPQPFFEPRGTPISVYQRIEALSALGHEIDLVTYHVGKDVEFPQLKIHRVRKINMIQHVRIGPSRAKLLLDVLVFFKAIELLFKKRYDVIHCHEEAAFFGMFLARLFRTKLLYDMHSVLSKQLGNFDFGNKPIFVKIFEMLEKMAIKSCSAVITIASDLESYVKSVGRNIKVITIENHALHAYGTPVTPERAAELKTKLKLNGRLPVVYTGTYERYQGLDMALQSASIVAKQFPNVLFLFVGAKSYQAQEWTEKAQQMGLGDHTLFLDVVPPEEAMVFLAEAALLISPRLNSLSTPLKIYSYMYSGKAIVATDIPAHTLVLNSDMAVLVEPTSEAFADGIIRMLKNPALAEKIGVNAAQCAREKFNYQIYLKKVGDIYHSLSQDSKKEKAALPREI